MSKHKKVITLHQAGRVEKRFICPFPNCGKVYAKHGGEPDCCPDHRRFIADFLYLYSHLHPADVVIPGTSGLVVPGTKQYDLAVRNAIKKALPIKGGSNAAP